MDREGVGYKCGLQSAGSAPHTLLRPLNIGVPRTVTVLDTDVATAGSFFHKGIRAQGMPPKGSSEDATVSVSIPCTVKHSLNVLSRASAWVKCLRAFGISGETEINLYQVPGQRLLRIGLNSASLSRYPQGKGIPGHGFD